MSRVIQLYHNLVNKESRSAKIVRQAMYSLLLKGVSVVISFIYVPLILNYLDTEKYGIWLTIVTITNWIALFDIGLGNGLRNKLTEALAVKDVNKSRIYVSTTYALLSIITIGFLIVFNIANQIIPWNSILNTKYIPAADLMLLTSCVFSITILRFLFGLIGIIFISHQMSSFNDLINTISSLVSLLGIVLVSKFLPPGNLLLLAIIITLTPVLVYLIFSIVVFNSRFKDIRPSFKMVRFSYSRPLLLLSSQFFMVQLTALIIYASANVLVANLFNPAEVIVYNIAFTIFNATIMVMTLCLSPLWSSVTDAYALQDYDFLKKTLKKLNVMSILFSLGVLLLLAISGPLYQIWLKGKVEIPFLMSASMAAYAIIFMFQAPYSAFINGMGKVKITSSLSLVGITIYFVAAFVLSKSLGSSAGVILAISLSSIVGLIVQRIQVGKLLNKTATGIWNR